MSKFKVRIQANGKVRLFEVDRSSTSLGQLSRDVGRKFQLSGNISLNATLPNGTKIPLQQDADLKRAMTEGMHAKQNFVNVDIAGQPSGGSAQPAHQPVHQPVHQPAPQQHHQPAPVQHHQPAPVQQPVHQPAPVQHQQPASSSGSTTHFNVAGRAGGVDKLKFVHQQGDNCYLFNPSSSPAVDTAVEICFTVQPPALQFKLSTSTYKLTQTFNMPFPVDESLISRQGEQITLNFPDY